MSRGLSVFLLAFVIVAWGINWSVGKAILDYMPPFWAAALRTVPACVVMWAICLASSNLRRPVRGDIPVILNVGVLHMVCFSFLANIGMLYLPAGRSVVLAYTTPLWVLPAAWLFLGEPLTRKRVLGVMVGMMGLALLLRPASFDWSNHDVLLGHALILLAALCWAACIVYNRAHKWVSSPFQLLPWQTLLAAILLVILALMFEGIPDIRWSNDLLLLLGYSSMIGTVLAYWAMNTVNRGLPASVTSLALLGVPIFGLIFSSLLLEETIEPDVVGATLLIIAGVAIGIAPVWRGRRI